MGHYALCRSCGGTGRKFVNTRKGQKTFECRTCGGTGTNHKFWVENCRRCYCEITYPVDKGGNPPQYCASCRAQMKAERDAKWRTKPCGECGCELKYNVDWTNIPNYCPSCKEKKRLEREKQQAKWREKSCKNCGATIKYNIDWHQIPELCKSCIAKAKAKWKEKPCQRCQTTIKYHVDWQRIPDLCKQCAEKARARPEKNYNENTRFANACKLAGMSYQEQKAFSKSFHTLPADEKLNMSMDTIINLAQEWLSDNRGKFRREYQN